MAIKMPMVGCKFENKRKKTKQKKNQKNQGNKETKQNKTKHAIANEI